MDKVIDGSRYAFNVNDYVYVKLTTAGIEHIINKYGYDYFKYCVEAYKEPDGYYAIQMHHFMQFFGEMLWLGLRPEEMPFELNVYFRGKDLHELY